MSKNVRCLVFFSLLSAAVLATEPLSKGRPESELASTIEWKGVFGKRGGDEKQILVLTAGGFLPMPFLSGPPNECEDLNDVVARWMKDHPNALIVPVEETPLGDDAKFLFVWIVDKDENLNVALVRSGCTPRQRMEVGHPKSLLVSAADYDLFAQAVRDAEAAAINKKAGIWSKQGADGPARWATAEGLENEGRFLEAIAEYRAAIALGYEPDASWHRIGRCYESLEQYDAAIRAYDESLRLAESDDSTRPTLISKAICAAKLGGSQAAARAFGGAQPDCERELEPCLDLAVVHAGSGNPANAVAVLEMGMRAFISYHELKFDDLVFSFDKSRAKRSEKYYTAAQRLEWGLSTLAMYALSADDLDRAFRNAQMALSVSSTLRANHWDPPDPAMIEAGNFDARLVLSGVFARQGNFNEAKREVDLAKVFLDVGARQGGYASEQLEGAYAELRRLFPDQVVEIPLPRQLQPKKSAKPPLPAAVAAMSEEELIDHAAGDDPSSAFAAAEQLVSRHKLGKVSAAGLSRLVKDGLDRQQDAKRRWLSQYGVFIEDALDEGKLSAADYLRYAKGSAVVHEFEASYYSLASQTGDDSKVSVGGMVEGRVGGSLQSRDGDSREPRFSAVVTLDEITVDGVIHTPVAKGEPDARPNVIPLRSGSMRGFGARLAKTDKISVGGHKVVAQGKFTIYKGDLESRSWDIDWTTVEPLVVVPFSVSTEFEVERD